MAHPIVHVEIPATNAQALGDFYKNIFGWKLQLDPMFNYLQFSGEGGPNGAFVEQSDAHREGSPVIYIGTDDVEGDLAQVEAAGGQVLMPKMEIPGVGWMGMFRDPSGNHVGLITMMPAQS